jgi:hypothetical protein
MAAATSPPDDGRVPVAPAPVKHWRDRLAAVMLWLATAAALVAAVGGIGDVADAGGDTRIVEAWRAYGFVVFAGLFALLALWPRQAPGVWELVIFHKLALTVSGLAWVSADVTGAGTVAVSDGLLTVALVAGYVLTRGWTAWRRNRLAA